MGHNDLIVKCSKFPFENSNPSIKNRNASFALNGISHGTKYTLRRKPTKIIIDKEIILFEKIIVNFDSVISDVIYVHFPFILAYLKQLIFLFEKEVTHFFRILFTA